MSMIQIEYAYRAKAASSALWLLRQGYGVVLDDYSVFTTAKREDLPSALRRGAVLQEIGRENRNMELTQIDPDPTVALGDLGPGTLFKYPAGKALYIRCLSVGNLKGKYDVGWKSGNPKTWTTNLQNGNTAAADSDVRVLPCKGRVEWHEI